MSLSVPITTGQMMAGAQAYQPGAEGPNMSGASPGPGVSASVSVGNNNIALAVGGWIALGLVGLIFLDKWGFRYAHVP